MLLFLTTADTEILATARAAELLPEGFPEVRCANPTKLDKPRAFFEETLSNARVVMVRLLGGRRAWPEGLDELRRWCAELGVPLLAFGGEAEPDAELTALSTAPSGTVAEAFEYLRHGGVGNTENLLRFVADTLLVEGYGFEPPLPLPELGVYHPALPEGAPLQELLALHDAERPTVGIVFYRAHWMGGNTAFVDALVHALEKAGANALPVYCYSLRAGEAGEVPALEMMRGRVDSLVTTVLAGGGSNAADAHKEGSPEGWLEWEVPALEALGV
ncbi:MAG: cobaltochelatase subunit CobN, partial [Actinomycetota bacterium]|nr:cobaltochelatase subunit CobN [Actinomycetota bacterium]